MYHSKKFNGCLLALLTAACTICAPAPAVYATNVNPPQVTDDPSVPQQSIDAYPNTWKNTGKQSKDLVEIALSQYGYRELDDNHTKYGVWFYKSDLSAAWCSIFISWCANQANIPTSVISPTSTASGYNTGNMSSNTLHVPAYAFGTIVPRVGDIIYVGAVSTGTSNHTGIIYAIDDNYIYTVEGNSADMVNKMRYDRSTGLRIGNSKTKIIFYACPKYSDLASPKTIGSSVQPADPPVENSDPKPQQPASAATYVVTASSLCVRSGPSTAYSKIGGLVKDAKVSVIETRDGWGHIKYDQKDGWICLQYCKPASSDTTQPPANSSVDSSSTSKDYKVTASSLSVRTGPSTSYSRIGSLVKETVIKVLEEKSGWGRISYSGKEGWVSLDYCSALTSKPAEKSTPYTVTASSLVVRSGAGTTYDKLGGLSKNTVVNVLEKNGDWGRISYNGKDGWICLKYCKASADTSSPSGPESGGDTVAKPEETNLSYTVNTASLNVRSGPATSYSSIGGLVSGQTITVLETQDGWGRIKINGTNGWVCLKYCVAKSSGTTNNAGTSTGSTGTSSASQNYQINVVSLIMRNGPDTAEPKILSLPMGTKVTVTETSNKWGKITYSGKTGWIYLPYCIKL